MRYIVLLFVSSLIFFSCNQSNDKQIDESLKETIVQEDANNFAQLEFLEDFYDFGTIKQNEVVSYTFKFTNLGNIPLIIENIASDCGCTKSKVSSEIIKPNEVATIEVIFDSSGWRGVQYKSVTIRTNGKIKNKSVTIKANVVT